MGNHFEKDGTASKDSKCQDQECVSLIQFEALPFEGHFGYISEINVAVQYFSMNYFFYIQTPLQQSEIPSLPILKDTYFMPMDTNPSLFMGHSFFMPSTHTMTGQSVSFEEFPAIVSQQDFPIQTSNSLQLVINEPEDPLMKTQSRKRERNLQKQIQSAKKNSESNLINHFFSYFSSRQKSEKMVESIINIVIKTEPQREKLQQLFYNTMHVLNNRRGRSYINKKNLLHLFKETQLIKVVPEAKQKIQKITDISLRELCEVFRRCCFCFYRTHSITSILTSKRTLPKAQENLGQLFLSNPNDILCS